MSRFDKYFQEMNDEYKKAYPKPRKNMKDQKFLDKLILVLHTLLILSLCGWFEVWYSTTYVFPNVDILTPFVIVSTLFCRFFLYLGIWAGTGKLILKFIKL